MAYVQCDLPFLLIGDFLDAKQHFKTIDEMKNCPEYYLGKTYFAINDEDGCFYIYNSSNTIDSATGKWRPLEGGISGFEEWQPNTDYVIGDKVLYDNGLYKCITEHTSTTDFEADKTANWSLLLQGETKFVKIKEVYDEAHEYNTNENVIYNNNVYTCLEDGVVGVFDSTKWSLIIGKEECKDWQPSTEYNVGDVVKAEYCVWKCLTNHTSGTEFVESETVTDVDGVTTTTTTYWSLVLGTPTITELDLYEMLDDIFQDVTTFSLLDESGNILIDKNGDEILIDSYKQ